MNKKSQYKEKKKRKKTYLGLETHHVLSPITGAGTIVSASAVAATVSVVVVVISGGVHIDNL